MPKRSNQFQEIVTYIAEQLAPLGAVVKESVELPEIGLSGVLREVDTLIEADVGLTHVRIAVESRSRSRKDDIQWVDDLIGKYKALAVDRVVAVSDTGFSDAAKLKAEAHNIDLLSPQKVRSVDWPAEFRRFGIASIESRLSMVEVTLYTTPPFTGELSLNYVIQRNSVNEQETVGDWIEAAKPIVLAGAKKHISDNFVSIYKTLEDVKETLFIDHSMPVSGLSLIVEGSGYLIDKVTFRLVARHEVTDAPVEHRLLKDILMSSGRVHGHDMVVVQKANAPRGRVFYQPTKTEKPPRPRPDK